MKPNPMNDPLPRPAGKSPAEAAHPATTEWMDYLYGEVTPTDEARLAGHLAGCAACRRQVGQWRGAMAQLDEGRLPFAPAAATRPFWHWAAAAALFLGLGVLMGVAATQPGRTRATAQLREDLRRELAGELRREWADERRHLLAETSGLLERQRAADGEQILAALHDVGASHHADYESLHQEMENLALTTQKTLWQAQQQIVSLAGATDVQRAVFAH